MCEPCLLRLPFELLNEYTDIEQQISCRPLTLEEKDFFSSRVNLEGGEGDNDYQYFSVDTFDVPQVGMIIVDIGSGEDYMYKIYKLGDQEPHKYVVIQYVDWYDAYWRSINTQHMSVDDSVQCFFKSKYCVAVEFNGPESVMVKNIAKACVLNAFLIERNVENTATMETYSWNEYMNTDVHTENSGTYLWVHCLWFRNYTGEDLEGMSRDYDPQEKLDGDSLPEFDTATQMFKFIDQIYSPDLDTPETSAYETVSPYYH